MAQINMASVMSKVNAWAKSDEGKLRCQEHIDKCRKEGKQKTDGGGIIITEELMCKAAETMISILKQTAQAHQLPTSVLDHFNSLEYSQPKVVGTTGNKYQIDIWFADNLSRMSLLVVKGSRAGQRTGQGIKNIVSLFDTGYSASSSVFGVWDGHEDDGIIKNLAHRDGKRFMSEAIESFNRVWGKVYDVYAVVSADPEFYSVI